MSTPYTVRAILGLCAEAQEKCMNEWRSEARRTGGVPKGYLHSRGRWLTATYTDRDARNAPYGEGETFRWDGTARGLREFLNGLVLAAESAGTSIGGISDVCVFGGYNFAASPFAHNAGEYDPLVCEWEVKLEITSIPDDWWAGS